MWLIFVGEVTLLDEAGHITFEVWREIGNRVIVKLVKQECVEQKEN